MAKNHSMTLKEYHQYFVGTQDLKMLKDKNNKQKDQEFKIHQCPNNHNQECQNIVTVIVRHIFLNIKNLILH